MSNREIALENEILRGVVGSTVHGTAIEGQDDRDEMGIFIEPPENVCGLTSVDHYIYRDQPDGVRSQPGDLDLSMYSLRKFCRLAEAGNPSILMLLWLPEYITKTNAGSKLIEIRQAFISKTAGKKYLGYLTAQKKSFTGERTQKVNRPDLISKYGYDTKFAMHALRLGYQGLELICNRNISLPCKEPELSELRAIRTGQFSYEKVINLIESIEWELKFQVDECPHKTDTELINKTMVELHMQHWG
jgi:hypothetical protein